MIDAAFFAICTIRRIYDVHVYTVICIFTFGESILKCFTYKEHIHVRNNTK